MISESTLDKIEVEAGRLAKLQRDHTDARTAWKNLRVTAQGSRGSAHTAFQTIGGLAHQIRRAEDRISALLDGEVIP